MNTVIIPEILLPSDAEIKVWAVNACDQYTSDLNYWKTLEKFVGDRASTLKLVYPEIYLN